MTSVPSDRKTYNWPGATAADWLTFHTLLTKEVGSSPGVGAGASSRASCVPEQPRHRTARVMAARIRISGVDEDAESAVGHTLDVERHHLGIHHGGQPRVLHDLRVHLVAMPL